MNHPTETLLAWTSLQIQCKGKALLSIDKPFTLESGEVLGVLGASGSGKSLLARVCSHELLPEGLTLNADNFQAAKAVDCQHISREEQQRLWQIEDYNDDSDLLNTVDRGTTLLDFLCQQSDCSQADAQLAMNELGLSKCAATGIRYLSTGEFRRTLLCRALLKLPQLLLVDRLFEGIDHASLQLILQVMKKLRQRGCSMILQVDELDSQVLELCDQVIALDGQGGVAYLGAIADLPAILREAGESKLFEGELPGLPQGFERAQIPADEALINLKEVSVAYDGITLLNKVNWTVKPRENWLLSGPNGCGKTTLLSLVTGECQQAFGQDVHLFGRKRDSGETLQQIRARIGLVTTGLHLRYDRSLKAKHIIVSGFNDSIGLYKNPTRAQVDTALEWLELMQMGDCADRYFDELSYGQQRLLLLARAMIKQPHLLILDEPCQGLDHAEARAYIRFLEKVIPVLDCALIFVSHEPALIPKLDWQEFFSPETARFERK